MEYRILQEGEIVQLGDETDNCRDAWRDDPVWEPVSELMIGRAASDPRYPAHRIYRRPTTLAVDLAAPSNPSVSTETPNH